MRMRYENDPVPRVCGSPISEDHPAFLLIRIQINAIGWFALLLSLLVAVNALNVMNSYVGRDFMTAVSDRRMREFVQYGVLYAGVFIASSIVAAFYRFSEERLRLLWRAWLTGTLIDRYLSK